MDQEPVFSGPENFKPSILPIVPFGPSEKSPISLLNQRAKGKEILQILPLMSLLSWETVKADRWGFRQLPLCPYPRKKESSYEPLLITSNNIPLHGENPSQAEHHFLMVSKMVDALSQG